MTNEYTIREITEDDIPLYYISAFLESDPEAKYYTGTVVEFTKDQITNYVKKIVNDKTRLDYLILKNKTIIGEVVLTELDCKSCHFRICIFKKENFSKGIGKYFTIEVLNRAFNLPGIQEIELEVFPFNTRGIALYKKLGFKEIERVFDQEARAPYKDIIVMKLKKCDFQF